MLATNPADIATMTALQNVCTTSVQTIGASQTTRHQPLSARGTVLAVVVAVAVVMVEVAPGGPPPGGRGHRGSVASDSHPNYDASVTKVLRNCSTSYTA